GRALHDEGQAGPRAEADIDPVGRHGLLDPRVAAEAGDLEVEPVLPEDAGALPDIGRHEREGFSPGLADAQGFRLRVVRRQAGRQRKHDPCGSSGHGHWFRGGRSARSLSRSFRVALSSTFNPSPKTTPYWSRATATDTSSSATSAWTSAGARSSGSP